MGVLWVGWFCSMWSINQFVVILPAVCGNKNRSHIILNLWRAKWSNTWLNLETIKFLSRPWVYIYWSYSSIINPSSKNYVSLTTQNYTFPNRTNIFFYYNLLFYVSTDKLINYSAFSILLALAFFLAFHKVI